MYLKHDNGYTYGGIDWRDLEEDWSEDEDLEEAD